LEDTKHCELTRETLLHCSKQKLRLSLELRQQACLDARTSTSSSNNKRKKKKSQQDRRRRAAAPGVGTESTEGDKDSPTYTAGQAAEAAQPTNPTPKHKPGNGAVPSSSQ